MSPVCMAAGLHFDLSVSNFGIQEYMHPSEETDRVFTHSYTFAEGMMHPGDAPGLGVELDEKLAATYPYRRAYFPPYSKIHPPAPASSRPTFIIRRTHLLTPHPTSTHITS